MKPRRSPKRDPKKAHSHPLARLRDICGWTRLECAGYAGVLPPTIQNIERSSSPFTVEIALALEAATSCTARSLLEAARAWATNEPGCGQAPLTDRWDRPFTSEIYRHYVEAPVSAETVAAVYEELGSKVDLLLHAVAGEGHRFRVLVQRFQQFLNGQRENAILGDGAIERAAERQVRVISQKRMTIAEASAWDPLKRAAKWQAIVTANRFPPDAELTILQETLPFWACSRELAPFKEHLADFQSGRQDRLRVILPDGSTILIPLQRIVTHAAVDLAMAAGQRAESNKPGTEGRPRN